MTKHPILVLSFKKYFEKLLDVNHAGRIMRRVILRARNRDKKRNDTMRYRSLISPEEAAGYAMAPSLEDMAAQDIDDLVHRQPEVAFRNGHAEAARRTPNAFEQLLTFVRAHADLQWFREHVPARWSGRAHA
jgi:hypothetical protein